MNQRGQIPPTLIIALGGALIVVGSLAYAKWQSHRYEAIKAEYGAFQAQVKANGEAAIKAKQAQEAKDKATKEKTDNETKTLRARNAALNQRLRDYVTASGGVSSLPPTTGSPNLICFDRTELDGAIQDYRRGFLSIAEKGTAAVTDLTLALKWAREITPSRP